MTSEQHRQAAVALLCGDDGQMSENGRLFLEWLRISCQWGVSPLAPSIYTSDQILLGAMMGRQEIYTALLTLINRAPEAAMQTAIEEDEQYQKEISQYGD